MAIFRAILSEKKKEKKSAILENQQKTEITLYCNSYGTVIVILMTLLLLPLPCFLENSLSFILNRIGYFYNQ